LVGNNLVNIASTAIATVLFTSALGASAGPTVSTIVMTVVVLIFGEISPKSLAKENAESFAMISAPMIRILIVLLKPINFFFTQLKKGLKKLFRVSSSHSVTDSELLTIVEEAEQEGGIDEDESAMLRNVIEFDDIEAIDIMTPRVDVEAISKDTSKEEIARLFRETGYSRLPVYEESIDSIIGVIHEKNFYAYVWGTENSIESILKPAEFIPPAMKISALLKLLQQNKLHMAVIVDEFGGTEGIVALEDVIEELVGDLFDFFHIQCETEASTINGWFTENLDRIPETGDSFEYEGLLFTVIKAENNRAEEITVKGEPLPEKQDEEEI